VVELSLTSGAKDEYREAIAWYRERSEPSAERFEDSVNHAFDLLRRFPELGGRIDRRHRGHVLVGWPYQIVYRLIENRVVVVALAHAKLLPGYWKKRGS